MYLWKSIAILNVLRLTGDENTREASLLGAQKTAGCLSNKTLLKDDGTNLNKYFK